MKKFIFNNLWWLVLIGALILLLIHMTSVIDLKIDTIALALLAIMLISPFSSAITRIKIGDFEAEIKKEEVKEVQQSINNELSERDTTNNKEIDSQPPLIYRMVDRIRSLVNTEPIIALAELRDELDRVISKLDRASAKSPIRSDTRSINIKIRDLIRRNTVTTSMAETVKRIMDICQRAIHGENIQKDSAILIVDAGTNLIEHFYSEALKLGYSKDKKEVISSDTVKQYEDAQYQLITITPYVDKPVKNVRIVSQYDLNDILDGYNEYAEFIVDLRKIDKEVSGLGKSS